MQDICDPYAFIPDPDISIRLRTIPKGRSQQDLEDAEVFEMDGWEVVEASVPTSKLSKIGLCQGIQHYGECYSTRCYFSSPRNGSTAENVDCDSCMNLHFAGYGRCVDDQREIQRQQEEAQAQEEEFHQWIRDDVWDAENLREQLIEATKQEPCVEEVKPSIHEQPEDAKTSEEPLDDMKQGNMVEFSSLAQFQAVAAAQKKEALAKKSTQQAPAKKSTKKAPQKSSQYRVRKKAPKKQPEKRQTQTDPPASDI
jgi:hypothetical protein